MRTYYYQVAEDPEYCDEFKAETDQEAISLLLTKCKEKGEHLSAIFEWPESNPPTIGPRTIYNEEDYMNVPADAATATGMYDRWDG